MTPRTFDVVIATDCRLPGGTAASTAEEIRAQAAAGYRTGLLQIDSALVARRRPFNERLASCVREGTAEVITAGPVSAGLLAVRHPAVAAGPLGELPYVDADVRLLLVNQAPTLHGRRERFYEPREIDDRLAEHFGGRFTWAPIGPLVREALRADTRATGVDLPLTDHDWVNVIDPGVWAVERVEPPSTPTVIGRHGRDSWHKWPADRDALLAAYPDRPDVVVEILGGAEAAERVLGGRPPNWRVHPYGAMPVRRFLGRLDFFVYFHHPRSVEAFGRTILEALASGAAAILPHHFAPVFADGATYTDPAGVLPAVTALRDDPSGWAERCEAGRAVVRERFSHAVHRDRLRDLIGEPRTGDGPVPAPSRRRAEPEPTADVTAPAAPEPAARPATGHDGRRRCVLFVSSNGAGLGHLTRLMSLARRTGPGIEPLFVTMSQAVSAVRTSGFPVEYVPSRKYSGLSYGDWHDLLETRLNEIIARHDPRALVFDGTHPYRGMLRLRETHPDLLLVWSRRAMWRPGIDNPIEFFSRHFDVIIEPGEFAGEVDRGATTRFRDRDEVVRVAPVLFLDESELLSREDARRELGIPPERTAALVQLGAGNINDIGSTVGMVVQRLAREPGLTVSLAESTIADEHAAGVDVHRFSVYPLSRYLRAFDLAVAAAGYNTYHELIAFGVPTIFVPNLETQADDQAARAAYAERVGVGLNLPEPTPEALEDQLDHILDPDARERMRRRAGELHPGNGAADAATAIETAIAARGERARSAASDRGRPTPSPVRRAAWRLVALLRRLDRWFRVRSVRALRRGEATFQELPDTAKRALRPLARPIAERVRPSEQVPTVLFVLDDVEPDDLERLLGHVAALQTVSAGFRPVYLTTDDDFDALRRHRALFEFLMPRTDWERVTRDRPWSDYVRVRTATLVRSHGADHVITVPGGWSPDGLLDGLLSGLTDTSEG